MDTETLLFVTKAARANKWECLVVVDAIDNKANIHLMVEFSTVVELCRAAQWSKDGDGKME
jgi:hypothetical protein